MRAVQVAPQNKEARRIFQLVRWDHQTEITLMGGQTSTDIQRGGDWFGLVQRRINAKFDASLAVASHELQEISPGIGAVTPTVLGSSEVQVQPGLVYRPNARVTLGTIPLFRNTQLGNSYMLWPEAIVTVRGPIAVLFGMRPSFDVVTDKWSNAVIVGTSVRLPKSQGLTLRMLQTSRRELEPPVTILANYEASIAPRFRLRAGAAHGNGTQFRFTNVFGVPRR